VGDGPEMYALQQQAVELNVATAIVFMGAVEQEKVKEYLAAADVFLSFYDLSNLGNPIMEAMNAGLPIVTIDVGDTHKLIKHLRNGILIPANNLKDIPNWLMRLNEEVELRKQLAQASKSTADDIFWSWEQRIQKELTLVLDLIT
jgi:glycosyltransferase involved in cell wall biosynthesis